MSNVSTMKREPRADGGFSLLGESFDAPDAMLYVYRDAGNGRPEGTYLKRYSEKVELEDLRKDLGPGLYILIQNRTGTGGPLRRSVFIPADPGTNAVENVQPTGTSSRIAELRELLEMKMIADQLTPQRTDPLEMLQAVVGLVRGSTPADPLDAFLRGAKWKGDGDGGDLDNATPADPLSTLAAAGARMLESRVAGGENGNGSAASALDAAAMMKKLVVAFNERMTRTEQLIAGLAARISSDPVPAPPKGESMSVSLLEIFQALLVGTYESGEHVAIVLRTMDKAAHGDLRREIESYPFDDLITHLKQGLESAGHAERFDAFSAGLKLFLKK